MDRCLRIGLSGGIGSGKSEVSRRFEALGVPVYDADVISRELVKPGQAALQQIQRQFGPQIVTSHGGLDRAALRKLVFNDTAARRRLEGILHPRVRARLLELASEQLQGYCILSIPLLLETGFTELVDRVLMVDTSPELQQHRASSRDGVSSAQIHAIMDSQVSRQHRLEAADDVIHNESDLAGLDRQVLELHRQYLELAAA